MTNPSKQSSQLSPPLDAKQQPPSSAVSSTSGNSEGASVKRMHSLTSSIKGLFIKSPKHQPTSGPVVAVENEQVISPLQSASSPRSSHNSTQLSPLLSAKSSASGTGAATVGPALVSKKPTLPTIYTSEESTTAPNDIGFIPLNSLQDENIQQAAQQILSGSTSHSRPTSRNGSRVTSRTGSRVTSRSSSRLGTRATSTHEILTVPGHGSNNTSSSSNKGKSSPALVAPSNSMSPSQSVQTMNKKVVVQELGITVYEDYTHEHLLGNIKALEKLPTTGGILSGFLRRSSTAAANNNGDNAFSLLPEQNRLDFQKRLSMQSSRGTFDSEEEDDDEEEEEEDSDGSDAEGISLMSDDDDFQYTACIGDNQLNLINKLKEKISKNEDPSVNTHNYKLVEKYGKAQGIVGKGAYGLVKLVSRVDPVSKAELFYAVKELKQKDTEDLDHFSNRLTSEFVISNSLKHMNIVRTIDLMKTSTGIYSEIMEYCAAGDLYTLISKTNRDGLHYMASDCFFKQMLNGVHFMHAAGVAHCDLKPENVLLTSNGIVKISDFGTAAVFRASWEKKIHYSTGACGSEPYVAPEEFKKGEYDPRLVDVWSLGIMYLTMMTGSYAWTIAKEEDDDLYERYLEDRPRQNKTGSFPAIEGLLGGPNARSRIHMIYQMLDPNPKSRATTSRVLQNVWVKEISLCEAVAGEYEYHQYLRM